MISICKTYISIFDTSMALEAVVTVLGNKVLYIISIAHRKFSVCYIYIHYIQYIAEKREITGHWSLHDTPHAHPIDATYRSQYTDF